MLGSRRGFGLLQVVLAVLALAILSFLAWKMAKSWNSMLCGSGSAFIRRLGGC